MTTPRSPAVPRHTVPGAIPAAAKIPKRAVAPDDVSPAVVPDETRPAVAPDEVHPIAAPATAHEAPWMKLDEPATRMLKVYALDPSAGNYVGNVMSLRIRWEHDLEKGPIGRRLAVVDYDAANKCYYPPVDLNHPFLLARGGLDPSESDPRFHQQMVYAVAAETLEKFETALGRTIHWWHAERLVGSADKEPETERTSDDIWVLKLYPHAMVQPNAFYCREAHGILFGYFRASETNPGNNLPGQRVFTCLSHDIIAHEVTHAIIDGIRAYFTEPTNPDVLAFHEAFADLTALFLHFTHKEALLDTIRKTGGRLYPFELRPDAAPVGAAAARAAGAGKEPAYITAEMRARNPLIELAQQFGEASGMGRGLRSALAARPDPKALDRASEPHERGSILVAAVFDAYFSTYLRASADLFSIYRAGGGQIDPAEIPASLANRLSDTACKTADEFFQLCARALDYCPPVDIKFGDFLRALITAHADLKPDDDRGVRQALMQAFRVRGICPSDASFFSEDALRWPRLRDWDPRHPVPDALPPVAARLNGQGEKRALVFGATMGLSKAEKDLNGAILRQYAWDNAERLGFVKDEDHRPEAPSFHQVFRVGDDGRMHVNMVVELVQTRCVPFEPEFPNAGEFPLRGGVTLIVAAPSRDASGRKGPKVRFAIGKKLTGKDGEEREASQRSYHMAMGLMNGDTKDARHFQANFGLVHQGM